MAQKDSTAQPRRRGRPLKEQQSPQYECNSFGNNQWIYHTHCFDLHNYFSEDCIKGMVKDPMGNNQSLRKVSRLLYSTNGILSNAIDYMVSLHQLQKVVVAHGDSESEKARNKTKMLSTLRTIKDKQFMRDALFRDMIDGCCFYYFETTTKNYPQKTMSDYDVTSIHEINEAGINAAIISLPADYTRIVGRKNSTYVLAFNLTYFDNYDGEIRDAKLKKYPKEIRDAWRKFAKNPNGKKWYVLDSNHTITHKIKSEIAEPWGRPLVLPAIDDMLYDTKFKNTKRSVLDEMNNRVVYQTFPPGKDPSTSALTQKQQKDQHDVVRNAITRRNNAGGTAFVSIAPNSKIDVLDITNDDIFDSKNETNLKNDVSSAIGFAYGLLTGDNGSFSSLTQNVELISSKLFSWIEDIECELNKCINATIIKDRRNWVEVHYLNITNVNRSAAIEQAKQLYLNGKGSISYWCACTGLDPELFFEMLREEDAIGWEERKPHQTSYTYSESSESSAGRPTTDTPSDKTLASRGNNGNSLPSPSD